jgi:hypothetical protein
MPFGLRGLLLLVGVILFILAAVTNTHTWDYHAYGLACLAGAMLLRELGVDGRRGRGS